MQLICPNCNAEYELPPNSLGNGRDVRCAKCTHEWFQAAEEDFFGGAEEEVTIPPLPIVDEVEEQQVDVELPPEADELPHSVDFDDEATQEPKDDKKKSKLSEDRVREKLDEEIPDGVKPMADGKLIAAKKAVKVSMPAKLMGYAASILIFAIVLGAVFGMKGKIVSAWPPAAGFYEMAGFPVSLQGKELVMESLNAQILPDVDGGQYLLLEGKVINLTNDVQSVPQLSARLRSTNGENGDSWLIDTPLETLEPGESFTFKSDYPAVPKGVGSVNLTFVPTVAL